VKDRKRQNTRGRHEGGLGGANAPASWSAAVLSFDYPQVRRREFSAPMARPHCSLWQRPTAIKLSLEALVTRAPNQVDPICFLQTVGVRAEWDARSQAPAWECSIPGGSSLLPGLQKHSAPEKNGRLEPPRQGRSPAGAWERDGNRARALPGIIAVFCLPHAAHACAMCMGAKDAPIAPAVNASILFLLCVLAVVSGCFLRFLLFIVRQERAQPATAPLNGNEIAPCGLDY